MMLRVRCECGKVLKLTDHSVGKAIPCPACGRRIRIAPRNDASIEPLEEVESPLPASPIAEELYDFVDQNLPTRSAPVMLPLPSMRPDLAMDGPPCPVCNELLPDGAKICTHCGIDLLTGRPVNEPQERIEKAIGAASRFIPVGLFPFTPIDAARRRGGLATWFIFVATLLTSVIFFAAVHAGDDSEHPILKLQLWTGSRSAFEERQARVINLMERRIRLQPGSTDDTRETRRRATTMAVAVTGVPENARFHVFQLLSSALLHDSSRLVAFLYHVVGNLFFLLIFGLAVNEAVGSGRMLAIYGLLAATAAGAEALMSLREPLQATVGASGAISGLAGMYAVMFGAKQAALAMWLRLPNRLEYVSRLLWTGWLIAAWFCFNHLLPAVAEVRSEDARIAHAAHLIAFVAGVVLGLAMQASGWVDSPSHKKRPTAHRSP